jgi:predicted DsbA family dithiol-disulfide isomerase
MLNITYWSDFACPFCYIGEARLKKALAEIPEAKDARLVMRAFELDPAASRKAESDTTTRFAAKYGLTLEEAGRRIEAISRMGRAEGIDFRYASSRSTNTMDAHRLAKLAMSKNDAALAERVIEALFAAYFTDSKELADRDLLLHVGKECGLPEEEVREMLDSDRFKAEVRTDEREAAMAGVQAVPFFVIGRYGIPGALSVEDMKKVILQVLEESRTEAAPKGMSCDGKECRLE